MWQAVEGFSIIIFVILVFGIISLPRRTEKRARFRTEGAIPKTAMGRRVPDNSVALEQAARGKEPRSFSADQKLAPAP